jgi:hypothetical protein
MILSLNIFCALASCGDAFLFCIKIYFFACPQAGTSDE